MYDFDFSRDFKEVRELYISEKLSDEELAEGLQPEEVLVKVCLTDHAYHRMVNTYGREYAWEDVLDLIHEKGHLLFTKKNGSEFAIKNNRNTLVLYCKMYYYRGEIVLVLKTVVRKVIYVDGFEIEQEVYLGDTEWI